MKTTTIHVRRETHTMIRNLSKAYGLSMGKVVAKAVEVYRREKFLEKANDGYAALHADPEAWHDWQAEIAAWDVTLMDGLEDLVDDYSLEEPNVASPEE
jgi:hypothetical protein